MEHPASGISGRAVVILGAGASRGEAWVNNKPGVLPPLDGDFFCQLQKLDSTHESVNNVLEAARDLFGPLPDVTLEEFFVQAEFLDRVRRNFQADSGDADTRWEGILQAFREALLVLLEEAGVGSGLKPVGRHKFHQALFRRLQPDDAIVSFNYDIVADQALSRMGEVSWNPEVGYGVKATGKIEKWRVADRTEAPDGETVYLLKMHGSLNWRESKDESIELTAAPFDPASFFIIPPAWNKSVDRGIARLVWEKARRAIMAADVLIAVGYSLPRTDVWTRALLRACTEVREKPFDHVLIANPDSEARRRLTGILSPAIRRQTRVVWFDGFATFVQYLYGK